MYARTLIPYQNISINKQAMRVLKLFGNEDVTSVKTTVGAEQEYFLVDREMHDSRPDLMF